MNRKVVIKKYENRRLYDSATSRYINLDEVAQMVKEGRNVQVVDAATGKDLTRLVLTQIIAEDAKAPDSAFPLDILRQMVIASGKATQESTLKYMRALLEMYHRDFNLQTNDQNVAIINETMAEHVFPHQDPIGRLMHVDKAAYAVIGVARNSKSRFRSEGPVNCAYLFLGAAPEKGVSFSGSRPL